MNPSDDIFIECLVQLKADEGFRARGYICPAGALTIGYGRNIDAGGPGITEAEAQVLLANDITTCDDACRQLYPAWDTFSPSRRSALINLRFQLGDAGLRAFHNMNAAINAGDWKLAAAELLCSRLATQTANRTRRRARELEQG